MFRKVPKPGWKVLLQPGALVIWARWAERYQRAQMENKADSEFMQPEFVKAPWAYDDLDEFLAIMGTY